MKNNKNNKKELVLVTGGAGFIGSHIVDALIKDEYKVRVLDNLAPPAHNGSLPNWFNKKAEFIKGDVRNKKDWQKALKNVDYVFHIAGYMDFHTDYSNYIDTNVRSAALMFEVINELSIPVKKVIVSSSQGLYGEGKYLCKKHGIVYPSVRSEKQLKNNDWSVYCNKCGSEMKSQKELESDDVVPVNLYGSSKKSLEDTALMLGQSLGIPTVALRYTIVHGPRQSFRNFYSGALRQFVQMALAGEPIKMHEDGLQTRDFVHYKDLVSAHIKVLKNKKADYQVFNIGSGRADKVLKLAKIVAKECNVTFRNELGLYRIGTARHSVADISKLKKLGWKPTHSLEDNVRDYISWIKYYPDAKKYFHKSLKEMKKTGVIKTSKK